MNRFRSKKRSKDAANTQADSNVPPVPVLPGKSGKWGKKSKGGPEPMAALDLSTALPSDDNFRTSLLMAGLSARFSMLRDQDDPNSKIGKASDDSVLFPQRASRIWGNGTGLSDIAEVSSIHGSIRPPFAKGRADSVASENGYGTDEGSSFGGSVIDRPRRGEGNNLFGGRQKVFKIPVSGSGLSKNLENSPHFGGRALFSDDVSSSSFQQLRARERQQVSEQLRLDLTFEKPSSSNDRSRSPPLSGYNRNRETSSSTTSTPSNTRTSTAATSIASQGANSIQDNSSVASGMMRAMPQASPTLNGPAVERSLTKSKRLYEHGLDQHLHEQQHSAVNRLDFLARQRTLGGQPISASIIQARSVTNLNERFEQGNGNALAKSSSIQNLRAASPTPNSPVALGKFDFGINDSRSANASPQPNLPFSPPLSPPVSECDDAFSAAIQPSDRGKATALGAFSKPQQQYDEQQYSQRQLQMQQGRETPPLALNSPPGTAVDAFPPNQPRSENQPTNRSRSQSSSYRQNSSVNNSPPSANRQNRPAPSHPRREPPLTSFRMPMRPEDVADAGRSVLAHRQDTYNCPGDKIGDRGFHRMWNGEGGLTRERDGESDIASQPPQALPRSPNLPNIKYPLPTRSPRQDDNTPRDGAWPRIQYNPPSGTEASEYRVSSETPHIPLSNNDKPGNHDLDSPTLGPANDLSGLVRSHLRTDSGNSSYYGAPSPALADGFPEDTIPPSSPLRNNPKRHMVPQGADTRGPHTNYPIMNPHAFEANSMKPQYASQESHIARNANYPVKSNATGDETRSGHMRAESTETQREFTRDLAQRRKVVRENLRIHAETNQAKTPSPASRAPKEQSRAPPPRNLAARPEQFSPRASPRQTPFEYSMNGPQQRPQHIPPHQSMNTQNARRDPRQGRRSDEEQWKLEEQRMLRDIAKGPPQLKSFQTSHQAALDDRHELRFDNGPVSPRDRTVQNRLGEKASFQREPVARNRAEEIIASIPRRPSPTSSRASVRDRSGSDTSGGRSKSRNAYPEDSHNTPVETAPHQIRKTSNPPRMHPEAQALTSLTEPVAARARSNSKSLYVDNKAMLTVKTNEPFSSRTNTPSPFSANSTPTLYDSPATSVSTVSSPTAQVFHSASTRNPSHRKKSINKADISLPTFLSSTSTLTTVNLPPGASLITGNEAPPPLPPINPRRKRITTTQTMINALGVRVDQNDITSRSHQSSGSRTPSPEEEEVSTFSADEGDSYRPRYRSKLRKASSEGGNLNARARQEAMLAPSPAMPKVSSFANASPQTIHEYGPRLLAPAPVEGMMF
ncbi:MAG: hypothetical protein M1829_000548 [Trizodia sp. TS-e1964]|nr:MAG: hypothetical protein M1829_000548 [Trizodia sp. TS-e1964]